MEKCVFYSGGRKHTAVVTGKGNTVLDGTVYNSSEDLALALSDIEGLIVDLDKYECLSIGYPDGFSGPFWLTYDANSDKVKMFHDIVNIFMYGLAAY